MIVGTHPCSLSKNLVAVLVFATAIFAVGQTITAQLKASAQGGDVQAQLTLANAYLKGNGIKKNEDEAFKWFLAAAEQGNVKAQVQVASMYRKGIGVSQDKAASVPWYAKAAWAGDAGARFNLAIAYYNGDGVTVDDHLAYAWFWLAKDAGDPQAAEAVERTESEHNALWIADARLRLADMIESGKGVKPNPSAAATIYRELSGLEDTARTVATTAHFRLGVMQIEGRGVARDLAAAEANCKESIKDPRFSQGYACLGYLSLNSSSGPDYKEAFRMYRKAAELGHLASILKVGEFYDKGQGVKADKVEAGKFYTFAAQRKQPGAQEALDRVMSSMTEKEKARLDELTKPRSGN